MPAGPGDTTKQTAAVTPLGGVRADFVANLGRRMTELRQHWAAFEQEPDVVRLRDEVRRRLHALATRARLLEFQPMADHLEESERRLDQVASAGAISEEQVAWFHDLFRNLPSMAWTDVIAEPAASLSIPSYRPEVEQTPAPAAPALPTPSPLAPRPPSSFPSDVPEGLPQGTLSAVLVVGNDKLLRALLEGKGSAGASIEAERCDDVSVALDLARALAPDLVVLDFDLEGSGAFVAALAEDPLTEAIPVIAVGSWTHPDQGASLIHLGIAKALPKPVPPDTLRVAAEQALSQGRPLQPPLEPLGDLTVEEVADRLASQLRAGLVRAVRPESRQVKIALGEGTDALAAVWGAVARLRETLTIRSKGEVRFSADGPAGAVPLASWLDDGVEPPPRRRGNREPAAPERVRFEGRKVVVVDDDPAVTWFLSGLLRNAGAFVYEAHDGRRAFEIACRAQPDLVISDVIMPELDGFGLCREIKRDIALRDTPVILLSWKEDMLQRVRELGAKADGYLKKESTAPAILRRVHEVLLPKLRIESRLRTGGEVRGRLDGITGRSLLQLVCTATPDSKLEVRDALHVFDVEVRGGSPQTASRTANDGTFIRGHAALIALLALQSGRFHVAPSSASVRPNLQGDLASLTQPFLARARAAQHLLSGERLVDVLSLGLSLDLIERETFPASARNVIAALQKGVSPYDLVAVHRTPAALLESVLDAAAALGAIDRILGVSGAELLEPETARQLSILTTPDRRPRGATTSIAPKSSMRTEPPPMPAEEKTAAEPAPEPNPFASLMLSDIPPPPAGGATKQAAVARPTPAPEKRPALSEAEESAPTSLTEAVIREVLAPDARRLPSPTPPPMLDASELKPRSIRIEQARIPSLPPDAIVPGVSSTDPPPLPPSEPLAVIDEENRTRESSDRPEPEAQPAQGAATSEPEAAPGPEPLSEHDAAPEPDESAGGRLSDLPVEYEPASDFEIEPRLEASREPWPKHVARTGAAPRKAPRERRPLPRPSTRPARPSAGKGRLLILGALIVVIGWLAWWNLERKAEPPRRLGTTTADSAPIPTQPPAASHTVHALPAVGDVPSAAPASSAPAPNDNSGATIEDLPLPVGSRLPRGSGLVELRTQRPGSTASIDGKEIGTGHVIQAAVAEGEQDILIRWKGGETTVALRVRPDRRTRVTLVPP